MNKYQRETDIEQKTQELIDRFEEDFETNIKSEDKSLLSKFYNEFVDTIYRPTVLDVKAENTINMIKDKLEGKLTDEQNVLLNLWEFCNSEVKYEMVQEAFIYGFGIGAKIRAEIVDKYNTY